MTSVQSASVASSGSLTRNERLDRLPFNKAHINCLFRIRRVSVKGIFLLSFYFCFGIFQFGVFI